MLFNSFSYLIFFPVVVLLYFAIPYKARYLWLLAASYYFYMAWNPKYALLMGLSTILTYLSGLLIGNENRLADAAAKATQGDGLQHKGTVLLCCLRKRNNTKEPSPCVPKEPSPCVHEKNSGCFYL